MDDIDLTPLVATPQVHTDEHGVHRDDQGRECRAVEVDGEMAFEPADPELRFRPDRGACPECGAGEKAWCVDGCGMVDRVDQR